MEDSCLDIDGSMTFLFHDDEELQGKNWCQVSVEMVCSMGFSAKQARTPKDSRRFKKEGMKQHNSAKSSGFFTFLANQRWPMLLAVLSAVLLALLLKSRPEALSSSEIGWS